VHRWFRVGPIQVQPSEIAKLALVLYLAYQVSRREDRVNDLTKTLLPIGAVVGSLAVLVYLEPDLGTAALYVAITGLLLFLAGLQWRYLSFAGGAAVMGLAALIAVAPYRLKRIVAFLDPNGDPLGAGFQVRQSILAVANGGVQGLSLGEGRQKLFYLPEPHTDFIYAVIGEELGLLGAAAVVLAFLFFLWRGLRAAWKAPDDFGLYLAAGLTLAVVLQGFINMSVVLGLVPTKGIPLPFISAGGSSLVFTLAGVGLILNVSQHAD
jgi:cell division protein FtsW